jgi:hypothetical protein
MGTFTETAVAITLYLLPTKENKRPFSVSVCSKQTEVRPLQKTNGNGHFLLVPFSVCGIP